jgi:hypothetical protein
MNYPKNASTASDTVDRSYSRGTGCIADRAEVWVRLTIQAPFLYQIDRSFAQTPVKHIAPVA